MSPFVDRFLVFSTGWPCCEMALQELRRLIYQIVLDRSDNHVIEYGRTPYDELKMMKVKSEMDLDF